MPVLPRYVHYLMTTKYPYLNFAIFLGVLSLFLWLVVTFADKPLLVGAAGIFLIFILTAFWLPSRFLQWQQPRRKLVASKLRR